MSDTSKVVICLDLAATMLGADLDIVSNIYLSFLQLFGFHSMLTLLSETK